MDRPYSPPPNSQPSVVAWQGSPDHELRAQILAAARSRPQALYQTQRPPSPPPVLAVPQKLKPRRTGSARSNSGAGLRRPRHNSSASSSTSSSTSLLASRSNLVSAGLRHPAAHVGDENCWDLAQILSEVDARMAARRGTIASPAAAPALRMPKSKGRVLQRSVSADRFPFTSSSGQNHSGEGKQHDRRLADVAEDPCSNDPHCLTGPPACKRLRRSTSSGTAMKSRRSRSPSWEVEDPSSGSAYDDGIDWKRTIELLTPPAANALGAPLSIPARPKAASPSSVYPTVAQAHAQSPPRTRTTVSPQKRKVPPSPLKQTTSSDYSTSTPSVSNIATSQDKIGSSQTGSVRLGMGRATRIVGGGSGNSGRVTRFRPPFKPPSQAAAAPACASRQPHVSTQSVVTAEEMADEDTSFDSFDGMLASLEGSGELNEVYRLLDGD